MSTSYANSGLDGVDGVYGVYNAKDTELELSNICNAKCPLCYRNNKDYIQKAPMQRPLQDIIEQLDKFHKLESIKLVGTISEPTLYKDLFQLMDYLNFRDIEIEICTNGDTNSPDWWRELSKLTKAKDKVYFTICGSTQELHEVYRKGTNLKRIVENASAFKEGSTHKNDYAQLIRFKYNDKDFNDWDIIGTVANFSNLYWTETFLALPIESYKNMNQELYDKLKPNTKKYLLYRQVETQAQKKALLQEHRPQCIAKEDATNQITLQGEILPCYLFAEAHHPETSLNKTIRRTWSYQKIEAGKYDCCKFCDKNIRGLLNTLDLRYII